LRDGDSASPGGTSQEGPLEVNGVNVTQEAQFALVALVAILFVVDPLATVPLFLSLTSGRPMPARRAIARRAAVASFIVLAGFAVGGGLVFRLLGISVAAFKVAGGLLLLLTSLDMLRAQRSPMRSTADDEAETSASGDIALVPIAIPMLAGPGAIATVMVLMTRAGGNPMRLAAVLLAIAIACTVAWLLFRAALSAQHFLRPTTMHALERVMGLLLAALAVEFVTSGLKDLLPTLR
jgi:multiple antibiotic resistance protein